MEKPSLSQRASMSAALIAASLSGFLSPAKKMQLERGKAPKGKRWTSSSVYTAGGSFANVRGTYVRNPLIAAQMNAMHDAWLGRKKYTKGGD